MIITVFLVLHTITITVLYRIDLNQNISLIEDVIKDQSIYLNNLKESTLSRFNHLIYDNQFLKSNIENKVINSTDEITAQWLSFIQVNPLYSALSYVDLEGNEIIRVNQSSTGSYNVSDDHLSNISNY